MDASTLLLWLLLGALLGTAAGFAAGFAAARGRASSGGAEAAQGLAALNAGVSTSLQRLESRLHELEAGRAQSYGALQAQVAGLRSEAEQLRGATTGLTTALRAPHVRGRWGEVQLRRVVESAGMLPHVDFSEQATFRDDDGLARPDLVVHLAGDRHVVVDAKVPFAAYLEAVEATDEQTRAERRAAHARHLREHVNRLAAKDYWRHVEPSPEFVVLFVPAEPFLQVALEEDPALLETAFAAGVVVATPSTLVALLKTVAWTWRTEQVAENAREVLTLGRELHARLATFGGHVDKLGSALAGAVGRYNDAVGSLESRVLVSARRLADLGAAEQALDAPAPVSVLPRRAGGDAAAGLG